MTDQVERWYELNRETKHSRFPVIDQQLKVQGIVTAKDVMDYERDVLIEKVMTKHPITVSGKRQSLPHRI